MYNAFKVYTIPVLKSILALFIYSHLLSMVLDSGHYNHQAQCLAVACILCVTSHTPACIMKARASWRPGLKIPLLLLLTVEGFG